MPPQDVASVAAKTAEVQKMMVHIKADFRSSVDLANVTKSA